jgi:hypothetical protein
VPPELRRCGQGGRRQDGQPARSGDQQAADAHPKP